MNKKIYLYTLIGCISGLSYLIGLKTAPVYISADRAEKSRDSLQNQFDSLKHRTLQNYMEMSNRYEYQRIKDQEKINALLKY